VELGRVEFIETDSRMVVDRSGVGENENVLVKSTKFELYRKF
jgi:hypothetical protein